MCHMKAKGARPNCRVPIVLNCTVHSIIYVLFPPISPLYFYTRLSTPVNLVLLTGEALGTVFVVNAAEAWSS